MHAMGNLFQFLGANKSEMTTGIPIWPNLELAWDFKAILNICKFPKLKLNTKLRQGQIWAFWPLKDK